MKLPLFMVFCNVHIHFRIWTRIRNPLVTDPDPAKVPDPCGSGSTTLDFRPLVFFHQTIPPGPLIHGLEPFCIWLRIREDIRL
jgi:hypothetical protein